MVGIRAEAGSLRPNEGVAARSSVFLVVPRAEHGRRGRTVPLVAAGSQCTPMVALSVSLLFRSNTPFFEDVPSVFAIFVKNKQNARDIRQTGGNRGSGERGKRRPSGGFERDATVSTLPVPDVHPAKREEYLRPISSLVASDK